jgi:hypothetical protein
MSSPPSDPASPPKYNEQFLAGAYFRIQVALAALVLACATVTLIKFGIRHAAGLLLGGSVAFINFLWLKRSMLALTSAVAAGDQTPPNTALVLRFFLRYALLAVVAYVIINSSAVNVYGLIVGLLLSVPALLFEVMYEIWYALHHGE